MSEFPYRIHFDRLSVRDLSTMGKEFQLQILRNIKVSDLDKIKPDEKIALRAKLQRMQSTNENEPDWIYKEHWPLLERLQSS